MGDIGRGLIVFGVVIVVVGIALTFADRIPFIGRLPGDFVIRRKGFTLYFPLATMVLLSLALTLILNFIGRK